MPRYLRVALLVTLLPACRSNTPALSDKTPAPDTAAALNATAPVAAAPPSRAPQAAPRLGFDSVQWGRVPGGMCFRGDRYVVMQHSLEGSVGSDLFVRAAQQDSEIACTPDSLPGDIVLRNRFADYFGGLKGDLLFVNRTTGPSDALSIYDLKQRRFVFEMGGYRIESWPDTMTVRLWKETDHGPGLAGACPNIAPDRLVGIDSLLELNLYTFVLTPTGRYRCSGRQ